MFFLFSVKTFIFDYFIVYYYRNEVLTMINRKTYLDKLIENKDRQIIKVVTGVRRSGKSTLFTLYMDWLKSTGIALEQIIFINLEDLTFESLLDYRTLHDYIQSRLVSNAKNYVFIDEVQNCIGFEKAVDSLFLRTNVDLYITGSNAYMLSGELATLLSGRYITIDMLPLSFKEYCESGIAIEKSKSISFNEYLNFGSFPYVSTLQRSEQAITPYLEGIYNTILIKDVAKREGISDILVLESIVRTLASSIGSPISIKKIADTLASTGRKISVNTVDRYVRALTESYLFYAVDRYDIKGRQHLKTLGKYYMVDTGLRNYLLSGSALDIGHLIENIVYLELLRRGYTVNIGKLAEKEVDFVAKNMDGVLYIQVSATVLDRGTLTRELAPLQAINDNHPKILLTLDEVGAGANYEGIQQLNLVDWLLQE